MTPMSHAGLRSFVSPVAAVLVICTAACDAAPRADQDAQHTARDTAASTAQESVAQPLPALAVTIDDLPWVGATRPGQSRLDALRSLIDTLVTRGVPATGFANCDRVGTGAESLHMWVDAGLELGNHTAAHLDLNDARLAQWLEDARSCHEVVRGVSGSDTVRFRYPYLHQGPTAERQQAALDALDELSSPIAHVTIDNSDWILAVAYGEAVARGDSARAAEIGDAFVEHIVRATQHYQQVAREKTGGDVPHVLLLHANLLVADHIGTLLDRLQTGLGFRFITLAQAQQHPVYDRTDAYTGEGGLSFLYRIEPATPELASWDDEEARRLREDWR